MKHNEPSIAPKAHTKKYILALLLACGVASSQCHGNLVIVGLVITGAGLVANLAVVTGTLFYGPEQSTVSVKVHSYKLSRVMKYPIAGKTYENRWSWFQDSKGNVTCTYVMLDNGVEVPGSRSGSIFHLGGQNLLPLTKRVYKCEKKTPDLWYIESENSSMDVKISHTVTKPGGIYYTPPSSVDVDLNFVVNRLPRTCDEKTLTGQNRSTSVSIMRNTELLWSYPYENYDVIGGTMAIP